MDVVSVFLTPVLETLASLAIDRLGIRMEVEPELKSIESTLSAIQAVLQDDEQMQWTDAVVKDWLRKLKELAYVANDLIDEFASEAATWKARSKRSTLRKAGKPFLYPNRVYFRSKIGEKIKELNRNLAALHQEKSRYQVNANPVVQPATPRTPTTSVKDLSKTYGQDGQMEEVKKALLKNLKSKNVLVYSIYGMGGLGKTTLAKTFFHDPKLVTKFKLRIWVCVSEDFDNRRLIKAMLDQIDDSASKNHEEVEGLQRKLTKKLSRQRFLLILDDVWNQDKSKWDAFRNILFNCGAEGSAIIVTTRTKKIADMMTDIHKTNCLCLSRLSEEDSWSLFQQQAIGAGTREGYMKTIGRELLKKCGGVPLVINALESVMRSKNGEDEWKSVKESGIWNHAESKKVLSPLIESFYHLSSQLRQCFLYCCIFPKDHVLDKDDLIRLWMANGFIPTKNWSETGEVIFDELVSRSFIEDVEQTDDNFKKVTTCKIHDPMHDLGLNIMGDDCFNAANMAGTASTSFKVTKVRHLYCETSPPSKELQSVKSFFGKGSSRWEANVDPTFVIRMKYLRVLSVGLEEKKLLKGISRLAHLRYLDLSGSKIKVLPKSIIYLQNLQSFNLENCQSLSKLPKGLKHIKSLSYLNIRGCRRLRNMPDTKYLASQQMTIDGLVVKLDNRGRCEISDLKTIDVFGELELKKLQSIKNPKDAGEADLKSKSKLRKLVLGWDVNGATSDEDEVAVYEGVMEALQPPPNLKYLQIDNYPGSQFPTGWWVDSLHLQKLKTIILKGCRRCENLPPLEKLPLLEQLTLSSMPSVKYLVRGTYEKNASLFPALRSLKLLTMTGLEALMATDGNEGTSNRRNGGGVQMFKNLEDFELIGCENLREDLEENLRQNASRDDNLMLRGVRWVRNV